MYHERVIGYDRNSFRYLFCSTLRQYVTIIMIAKLSLSGKQLRDIFFTQDDADPKLCFFRCRKKRLVTGSGIQTI